MKLTTTLLLSFTIALATANTSSSFQWQALTDQPQFKYDPNTISPCVVWYNNIGRDSCEYTRSGYDNDRAYAALRLGNLQSRILGSSVKICAKARLFLGECFGHEENQEAVH
ncbi:hypothetical protein A0O28_0034760 [Trichoderma guizhouense]|uniref:SSCRP protein n=1 Tax=Trichoderma guizhouense TaxID=1491466 RepID=A0A1T3CMQ0_9HYPO|nr:hypothetical protein A0O28_0034760 [Trichoderma guizhouense]